MSRERLAELHQRLKGVFVGVDKKTLGGATKEFDIMVSEYHELLYEVNGRVLSDGDFRHRYNYPVWFPNRESTPTVRSDKLIITIATGQYRKILDLAAPWFRRYADRVGADYIELTDHQQGWWGLEKFRVGSFTQWYDRVLFLDSDILLHPETPDLFQLVPEDHVGIHDDYPHLLSLDWLHAERLALFRSQGFSDFSIQSSTCLNTGVVLFSKQHSIWNAMRLPFPRTHCAEQAWVEPQTLRYPVVRLDWRFNTQWYWADFNHRFENAWVVHYANAPNAKRMQLMSELSSKWQRES